MANINKELNDIKNAVYGKEVRGSIHDGIKKINEEVENTTDRQDSVEAQFQSVLDETTGKDVISAPEILAAKVGADNTDYPNLKQRLDTEHNQLTQQLAQTAKRLEGFYNVKWFGAKGDGVTDDTEAIQIALDEAHGTLFFPYGDYRVTGSGDACLYLTKNLSILGASRSMIRADSVNADTSVMKVSFNYNYGNGDVRNWSFKNMGLFQDGGGGKHALIISEGMQISSSEITNNSLHGNRSNGGYSIYVENNLGHSIISLNTITAEIYMKCWDANRIQNNLFTGERVAVTFDLITGVRNNTVQDNTIVNRDGSVHIINGSNIRIKNNQLEHGTVSQPSQNPKKTMVWIEGKDRASDNIVISENNFGGGTNLDRLIYIDNANKTVIEKNNLIAVNLAEIEITENAVDTIIKSDNFVKTQNTNPRGSNLRNANVIDYGVGTMGVDKVAETHNSWDGGDYFKDDNGVVHFTKHLSNGVTSEGNTIVTLPKKFRPKIGSHLIGYTDDGLAILKHSYNGKLVSKNIPSNKELKLISYPADEDEVTNSDYLYYDDFDRDDAENLSNMTSGQLWNTLNNNLKISNGEVKLSSSTSNLDIAYVDSNLANCTIQCRFKHIPSQFSKSCRLIFRYVDDDNYSYFTALDGASQWGLYKVVGGVETNVWRGSPFNYSDGDVVKVILKDTSVTIYVNDKLINTYTINENSTATKHGFSLYQTYGIIDDFGISI